jgi:hypothetical protein
MSYCTQCGEHVEAGRFCTSCGASLADQWRTDTTDRNLTAVLELPAVPLHAEPVDVEPAYAEPAAPARWRRRSWPWWPAALLALVLVCAVAWTLGMAARDGNDVRLGAPKSVAPGEVTDLTRGATATASSTAPPNQDLDGDMVRYDASNLLDGVPSTAWRMAGDGTGATLSVQLPSPSLVTEVGLINGYAKVDDRVDWYPRNRRVLEAEWIFDDGTTVVQHLDESSELQTMEVGPIATSTIQLRILIVSPPGDRNYTAISDLLIDGASA